MTIGIYGIFYLDECLYIGQSSNVEKRLKIHKNRLNNGTHIRKEFSHWFHEYVKNTDLLDFVLLEECNDSDYTKNLLEIKWFNFYKPKFFGREPSLNGKWKHSKETRSKIRESVIKHLQNPPKDKPLFERECRICNREYTTFFASSVYCSETCREIGTEQVVLSNRKKKIIHKNCNRCSRDFNTKQPEKEVCESCLSQIDESSYKAYCYHCKSVFYTIDLSKTYCSRKCSQILFRKENPDYLPKSNRFGITKEELEYLYHEESMKIDDIAEHFGCKRQTIYNMLNKYKIPKKLHTKFNR